VTIFELKDPEYRVESFINDVTNMNFMGIEFKDEEEEHEVRFKDGDILKTDSNFILIYRQTDTEKCRYYVCLNLDKVVPISFNRNRYCGSINNGKILSPESLPIIQDALSKVGKVWNAEKKCIEELKPKRWRAKKDCKYWFLNEVLKAVFDTEYRFDIDNQRYEIGNYFQTEQQAKDFAERIKQLPR